MGENEFDVEVAFTHSSTWWGKVKKIFSRTRKPRLHLNDFSVRDLENLLEVQNEKEETLLVQIELKMIDRTPAEKSHGNYRKGKMHRSVRISLHLHIGSMISDLFPLY
jgi:hypothetical protein